MAPKKQGLKQGGGEYVVKKDGTVVPASQYGKSLPGAHQPNGTPSPKPGQTFYYEQKQK